MISNSLKIRVGSNHSLPLLLFGIACISIVIALVFTLSGMRHEAELVLQCDEPLHDFGSVSPAKASLLHHAFVLRNTSNRAVRITKVFTSCGCTTTRLSTDIVAPHGNIDIPVNVKWGDRDGDQSARLTVLCDASDPRATILSVKGRVNGGIVVSPKIINFRDLDGRDRHEQFFYLSGGTADSPLKVTNVTSDDPMIEVVPANETLTKTNPLGLPLKFIARAKAGVAAGPHAKKIFIWTTMRASPITIPVVYRGAGRVGLQPGSLLFNEGGPLLKNVEVHIEGAGLLKPDDLRVAIARSVAGAVFQLGDIRYTGRGNCIIPVSVKTPIPNTFETATLTIAFQESRADVALIFVPH